MSESVRITGLRETIASLQRYGAEVSDLKDAFTRIGTIVADEAKRRAPKKSGALAASIRPSKTKNKSIVRAGSGSVPYAGVHEYGWPRRHIVGKHYLSGAADDKQQEVIKALESELAHIANKLGL